jgi:hypothetical protein
MESQKYRSQLSTNPPLTLYPGIAAVGTNLSLSGLWNPSGLVGYWNFEEGTGSSTIDQSGNGNTGSWAGTPAGNNATYYTGGKVGSYAGYFDGGSDYVNIPQTSTLNPTAAITVTAWINIQQLPSAYGPVIMGGGTLGSSYFLGFYSGGTPFAARIGSSFISVSPSSLSLNTWLFIAMDFQANGPFMLVKNGIVIASTTSSFGNIPYGTDPTTIGRLDYASYYFPGLIDDVRIYNRALSAAEIQALYNAQK